MLAGKVPAIPQIIDDTEAQKCVGSNVDATDYGGEKNRHRSQWECDIDASIGIDRD
jgi:hypothetical protein